MGDATTIRFRDPLATRTGMVRELMQTAELYPLVFVVISHSSAIPHLQQMILAQSDAAAVEGPQVILPSGSVRFGSEQESHKYRGTVPVFWDPAIYRRAG